MALSGQPQSSIGAPEAYATGTHIPLPGSSVDGVVAQGALVPGTFCIRGTDPVNQANVLAGTEDSFDDLFGLVLLRQAKVTANYAAGEQVPVLRRGWAAATCTGASVAGGLVHVVKATGAVSSVAAGTAQVTTATPNAVNDGHYALRVTFSAGLHATESFVIAFLADASATATEICDGLRVSLNADPVLSTLITESGTATLILTATNPEDIFTVTSVGFNGTWASITTGTAGAPTTFSLPLTVARFEKSASDGAVTVISLAM